MQTILSLSDLSITFPGHPPAVDQLSFQLGAGEQLGMLGLSGSGKSLTAKALLGLLPEAATVTSGTALYTRENGEVIDLFQLGEKDWRQLRGREISLVFQEPLTALNPVHTIGRQLEEATRNLCPDLSTAADRETHVRDWLNRVELTQDQKRILNAYPHELSGGQRQRILIALALLGQPRLLIADEPTTALDTITENGILRLLDRLRKDLGMTMIFITHDLHVLRRTTTRTLVLRAGRLVHAGTTAEILALPGAGLTDDASALNTGAQESPDFPPAPQPPALEVHGLHVNYRSGKRWPWSKPINHAAVQNVTFKVAAGEWVAMVGPSGCGKTTIARCLAGLLPADRGAFTVRGGSVQLVFQDPFSSLNPQHTVATILHEVLRLRPDSRHSVEGLLRSVGLPPAAFSGRRPGQLSGGQRQRVAIARALAAEPGVLIADEAVSALDAPLRAEILTLLNDLRQRHNIGVLFISHDLRLVRDWASRILIIEDGEIVEAGKTTTIFANPKAGLTRKLLTSL